MKKSEQREKEKRELKERKRELQEYARKMLEEKGIDIFTMSDEMCKIAEEDEERFMRGEYERIKYTWRRRCFEWLTRSFGK